MSASRTVVTVVELSAGDLPAYCPNPSMPLWASHPRIFLDVVNESEAMCPYCGTRYRLRPNVHVRAHEFDTRDLHEDRHQPYPGQLAKARPALGLRAYSRETPNLSADALGNTMLERLTQWLRGSR